VLYPESENIEEFSIATDNENNDDNNDETLGLHLQPETFEKLEEKIEKIQQIF